MTTSNSHLATVSPRRCVVCENEDREAIDRDLILKRRTQADIARQLGVNRSTVSRHYRDHVLPAVASAMISAPGDVSIGTMIAEFDDLYGSNRQIREMAFARDDLRLAKDMNVEQRRLLEVLLKHGDKIGAGSVSDAVGVDRDRWAELDRTIRAQYEKVAYQHVLDFAQAVVTVSELPDDIRGKIMEIFLRGQLDAEQLAALDARLAEGFGDDESDGTEDEDQAGSG
jgi:AcrR family transcriptional regulator